LTTTNKQTKTKKGEEEEEEKRHDQTCLEVLQSLIETFPMVIEFSF